LQLICRYGQEYPAIIGHVDDGVAIDMNDPANRECVVVPFAGATIDDAVKLWGRAGPDPELLGAPPTDCHPGHDKLDEAGVPDHVVNDNGKPLVDERGVPVPHPLRALAGKPYADRRRRAEDVRLPAAPPQSDPGVQRAYLAQQRWAREVAGLTVDVPGEAGAEPQRIPVATDRESQLLLETNAARAARRPGARVEFKGTDGVVRQLGSAALVALADAVDDHVQRLRAAEATVRSRVDSGEVRTFAELDAALGV
jgi:hypothetical protein